MQHGGSAAETVLVVEEEGALRPTTAEIIGILGYRVLFARSGEEAVEMLRKEAPIGVLFADLDALEGDGERLFRVARALRPGLRLVGAAGKPCRAGGFEIVAKPYRAADLIRLFPPLPLC